ncbi:hypothetical protein JCM10295v2_006352 [Rhodotorula toruloides]
MTIDAKRLHIYITKRPPEAPLIQITAGLAYKQLGSPDVTLLHFVGGILNLYPSPNRFRNLETLILRGVHHLGPRPAFMREWGQATIRNLCLMHDHVIEPRDIQNLSSTLEYLAYGPPRECENDFARLDNGVAFPASLRTITLMLPSDDRGRYSALGHALRQVCEEGSVSNLPQLCDLRDVERSTTLSKRRGVSSGKRSRGILSASATR